MPSRLTAAQIAARWGCSEEYVTRLARGRKLRALKLGRVWRFAPADVEAFERAHTNEPAPVVAERTSKMLGVSTSANPPAAISDGPYRAVVPGSVPWRSSVIAAPAAAERLRGRAR